MKKIFTVLAFAALFLTSCNKPFEVQNTATVNLAGNWMCTVFYNDGTKWEAYDLDPASEGLQGFELLTFNTAANLPSEIWMDDDKGFWGTFCKVDADAAAYSFGKAGKEFLDEYSEGGQAIWGGKVTVDGAKAPGSGSTVDKIEFFIAFSDDGYQDATGAYIVTPYSAAYYVVGYRRTGFPEDNDNFVEDWPAPAIPEVPAITEPLPVPEPEAKVE